MDSAPTLVIAEAGVNHNGSVDQAHRLIDAAADAGADVVKFQTFDPTQVVSSAGRTAPYQLAATGTQSQRDMLMRLTLPIGAWNELAAHCTDRAVEFLSTAFDWPSMETLLGIGLRRIKIPSGEVDNIRFISRAAEVGLPLVLSTGTADWADVDRAVHAAASALHVTLLHCVSLYPTPPITTNLSVIPAMRDRYGLEIGWSDHTLGNRAAVIAVALGATIIEKHVTIDRRMDGPDHAASLDPSEFSEFVRAIRQTETMLGAPVKRPTEPERKVALAARRSHHATRDLEEGQILSDDDTVLLRPADGAPAYWELAGRVLLTGVRAGEPIPADQVHPAGTSVRALRDREP